MQMRKLFYFLLERNRLLEVVLRNFITRFPNIKKFALKLFKSDQNKNSYTGYSPGLWSKYCDCLKSMAIQEGDIVLVHSSMKGLAPLGVNPNEIITF